MIRVLLLILGVAVIVGSGWLAIWLGRREDQKVYSALDAARAELEQVRIEHAAMIADVKLALELDDESAVPLLAADIRERLLRVVPSTEMGEKGKR